MEESIINILQSIGEDVTREGLVETPSRVSKTYDFIFSGYKQKGKDVLKTFENPNCNQMVLLKDIEMYSMCEHHMMPFIGKTHVAYIPNKTIVGISKLARLVEVYSRRLQIQERIGEQITSDLMEFLDPVGAACIIEAQHLCMQMRGIQKQHSVMVTSSLKGVFLEDSDKGRAARSELMGLV